MKPDGVTDEECVLQGYSKWKDRSSDKPGIEYYNLLMSEAKLGTSGHGLCYWSTKLISQNMYTHCHSTMQVCLIDEVTTKNALRFNLRE